MDGIAGLFLLDMAVNCWSIVLGPTGVVKFTSPRFFSYAVVVRSNERITYRHVSVNTGSQTSPGTGVVL